MSNNTEKAIEILSATQDGDGLSSSHLSLVQLGCNGMLSEYGQQQFDELYAAVSSGTYIKPWFHDIEHLTREHSGYVAWKGRTIEHYTFHDRAAEKEAAMRLAALCRSAEERGFEVGSRTTSSFSPFLDAPAGTPWEQAMMSYYTMFEENGKAKCLILAYPNGHAVAMSIVQNQIVLRYALSEDGCYTMFHTLQNEGMQSCGKRLEKYDSFVACMDEAGITPEHVSRVMGADVSSLLMSNKLAE